MVPGPPWSDKRRKGVKVEYRWRSPVTRPAGSRENRHGESGWHCQTDGFGQCVGRYWKAWHALGRERPVGEISDLAREPADRPPVARELLVDGALR